MPKESISIEIKASCEAVFDLIHDYDRRLLWDSMLKEAKILGEADKAGRGVRTRCVGSLKTFRIAMETEYISFERGKVAAVKLIHNAPFFKKFAASIQHEPIDEHRSLVTYVYSFQSRPEFLSFILEPVMNKILQSEVRTRLHSLKSFIEDQSQGE